jgi:predicted molibdopterin-dependent oxidoreductase YjgC
MNRGTYMVKIIIDGIETAVPEGTTVLEAAGKLGIWIPTLCHHEALTPYGGCRLCVVEVTRDGSTQIVSSCACKAADGIEVQTETEKVLNIRKFIIELLLSEAPQAKILQDLASDLGVSAPDRFQVRNELCISCGQCIRACQEIVGVGAIDFAGRGYERTAASPFFQRSEDCIGCGTCVAICPTGAIIMHDIAEGETATVPDSGEITGPARIIDNWKVGLAMKHCKKCGEPFAPQFQLDYISRKASLPDDFFDVCRQCRT